MKKFTLTVLILFVLANITNASIVDTTTAKNTARNFIFEKIPPIVTFFFNIHLRNSYHRNSGAIGIFHFF